MEPAMEQGDRHAWYQMTKSRKEGETTVIQLTLPPGSREGV